MQRIILQSHLLISKLKDDTESQNVEDEGSDTEDAGHFAKADAETLAKRRIIKVKR